MTTKEEKFTVQNSESETSPSVTWRLLVTVAYILTGSFIAGYCMTALNSPGNFIMEFMNETSVARGSGEMALETQTSLYGLLSAIFAIGAGLGSVCTQKLADFVGRHRLLAVCAIGSLISAVMMGLSKQASSYEMLFGGRALSGLSAGVQVALPPFYLAELLPRRYIGPAMLVNTMMVQLAALAVSIAGLDELFATRELWPVIVGSHGVFAMLQLCLFLVAIPSPFFLLNKHKETEARKALQLLRGQENVDKEFEEMKEAAKQRQRQQELTVIQLFQTASLRRPLLVNIMGMLSMLWTGVIIIIFYSVQVIMAAGFTQRVARYLSSGVTVVGITSTGVALIFVQRLPRRRMLLGGLAGMFVSGAVLSVSLILGENILWLEIIGVVCIPCMAASHAFGPAQVPWLLIPELFDDCARGSASSVCSMALWLSLFLIGYAFPPIQKAIGPYSVLPFVGLTALFFVFFLVFQPETLGRTVKDQTLTFDDPAKEEINAEKE